MPPTRPRRRSRIAIQVLYRSAVVYDVCYEHTRHVTVGEHDACDLRVPIDIAGSAPWTLVALDRDGLPELVVPEGSLVSIDRPDPALGAHGPYRHHGPRDRVCIATQRIPLLSGTHVSMKLEGLTFLITASDGHSFRQRAVPWRSIAGIAAAAVLHTIVAMALFIASPSLLADDEDLPVQALFMVRVVGAGQALVSEADWAIAGRRRSVDGDTILGVIDRTQRGEPRRALEYETTTIAAPTEEPVGRARVDSIVSAPTRVRERAVSKFAILTPGASYERARQSILAGEVPDPHDVRVEDFLHALPTPASSPSEGPVTVHLDAVRSPYDAGHTFVRVVVEGHSSSPHVRNRIVVVESGDATSESRTLEVAHRLTAGRAHAVVSYGDAAVVEAGWSRSGSSRRIEDAMQSAARRPYGSESPALARALRLAAQLACRAPGGKGGTDVVLVTQESALLSGMELARWTEDARLYCDVTGLSSVHLARGKTDLAALLTAWSPGRHISAVPVRGELSDLDRPGDPIAPDVAVGVEVEVTFDPATVREARLLGYEDTLDPVWATDPDGAVSSTLRDGEAAIAVYEVETEPGRNPEANAKVSYRSPVAWELQSASAALEKSDVHARAERAPTDLRLTIAVAGFAELLRGSAYAERWSTATMLRMARGTRGSVRLADLILRYREAGRRAGPARDSRAVR